MKRQGISRPKSRPRKSRIPRTPPLQIPLGENECFLCGARLSEENETDEHIFPRWLLHKFDLWNDTVTLLNGKSMPYRRVKIPCCASCNNGVLSELENQVRAAVEGGFDRFKQLPERTIFIWLLKIYFELLHLESRRLLNPADPSLGSTIPKDELERNQAFYTLLRSLLVDTKMATPLFSIFLVRTKFSPRNTHLNFDFRDNTLTNTFAIRMNDIGVIAALQDHSSVGQTLEPTFKKFRTRALHPQQFLELAAVVFYQASLLNRTPKYISIHDDASQHVMGMPLGGFSSKPIFDEWNWEHFARMLCAIWRVPLDQCFVPPNRVASAIQDASGALLDLPLED